MRNSYFLQNMYSRIYQSLRNSFFFRYLFSIVCWVFSWHRSIPIFIISILAFVFSLASSWLTLPSYLSAVIVGDDLLKFDSSGGWIPIFYKFLYAIIIPFIIVFWFKCKHCVSVRLVWLLFSISLLFPSINNYWDVNSKVDAEYLDSFLSVVVEEMEQQHDFQQGDWRIWQDITPPSASYVTQIPKATAWSGSLFLAANLPSLISDILGYSDSFLTFMARGWVFGVLGCSFLLLAMYTNSSILKGNVRQGLTFFFTVSISLFFVLQIPAFVGDYYKYKGDYYAAAGSPQLAINSYDFAIRFKPVYEFDSQFSLNYGRLIKQRGCDQCMESMIYDAISALNREDLYNAYLTLKDLYKLYPNTDVVRYRLAGVLSLLAVNDFNNHQYTPAAEKWHEALLLTPTSALAWYGLSLVSIHKKDFKSASIYSEQIYKLQKNMGFKSLVIPAQIHLYLSWHYFHINDLSVAHDVYRYSKLPESW